jgi:hypothetical protein
VTAYSFSDETLDVGPDMGTIQVTLASGQETGSDFDSVSGDTRVR